VHTSTCAEVRAIEFGGNVAGSATAEESALPRGRDKAEHVGELRSVRRESLLASHARSVESDWGSCSGGE
jgi:hypothetical protein